MRFTRAKEVSDKTWNESTHLKLIAAVMKVEEEKMIGSASPVSGKRIPKWKKIADLLPPAFRNTIPQNISAHGQGMSRKDKQVYKCARVFDMILRTYRVYMMQRRSGCDYRGKLLKPGKRLKPPPMLTEAVCTMLQKREDLRNATKTGAEGFLKSRVRECRRSNRISSRQRQKKPSEKERLDLKNPSEKTTTPGLLTVDEYGESSHGSGREQSMGTATEQAERTDFLSEREDFSRSSGSEHSSKKASENTDHEEIPSFDNNVKQVVIPTDENDIGQYELRQLCIDRRTADSTPRSRSRSTSESEHLAKRSNEQVQASERDRREPKMIMSNPARRKSSKKASQRKRIRKTSKTLDISSGRSGEHAHLDMNAITGSFLRRLDQEFSLLTSWVKSRVIPIQKRAVNEIIRSANLHSITSRESSKHTVFDADTNLLGHYDQLIHKTSRRMIDYQISALFLKLRIRFAEEFKKMSVELERISAQLVQGVLDDA